MRSDEPPCGYCTTLLDAHCTLHGAEFCTIKEQYYTDPTMGVDEVYDRLLAIATPEQIEAATNQVKDRQRTGMPPVPVPDPPVNPQAAEAAAHRWLDHWQHGR